MWIVEQLSSRTFYHYLSFWSTLLVKMCPIFDGSASNHFTRYQKILWVCSLECKKLLNFICLPMKFHNRVYLNIEVVKKRNYHGQWSRCPSLYSGRSNTAHWSGFSQRPDFWWAHLCTQMRPIPNEFLCKMLLKKRCLWWIALDSDHVVTCFWSKICTF